MLNTEATIRRDRRPRFLQVGVIEWFDDPDIEPTVIADRSPVTVARGVALAIYDAITEYSDAYAGATEFLNEHPPPQDWEWPEDVDRWLDDLREATPYPAFSFHQIPATGGVDGTNHTSVKRLLEQVLQEREGELTGDPEPTVLDGSGVWHYPPTSTLER